MVPSTPTSASGAFWKGSDLGNDPAAPSTAGDVVKSEFSRSTQHPAPSPSPAKGRQGGGGGQLPGR